MSDTSAKSDSLRRYAPCGCVLSMFVLMILLPAVGWMIWSARAARRLQAEFEKIRVAGDPMDADGLAELYALSPDREDATQLWIEVTDAFSQPAFASAAKDLPVVGTGGEPPLPNETWEQLEAVEKLLADYSAEMEKIHKATASGGGARFDLDFEQGANLLLPHTQQMRSVSRILVLEAFARAHRGDTAGVAETLEAMLIAPRALDKEPILVSQLVQNAMNNIAVRTLEKMLNSVEFSDAELQRLQQTVGQGDLHEGFRGAMLGERVIGIQTIRNPGQLGPQSRIQLPNRNEDLAFYLKYMAKWVAASREPFPQALDQSEAISQEFNEEIHGAGLGQVRYQLTAQLLPAMDAMFFTTARGVGATHATETFIAVARFRKRHGRLPDTLDELVPEFLAEVPIDPFDGKPLRYLITDDDAALIYSIGRNRVDDNGVLGDQRLDEVLRLEPMPAAPAEPAPAEPTPAESTPAESTP